MGARRARQQHPRRGLPDLVLRHDLRVCGQLLSLCGSEVLLAGVFLASSLSLPGLADEDVNRLRVRQTRAHRVVGTTCGRRSGLMGRGSIATRICRGRPCGVPFRNRAQARNGRQQASPLAWKSRQGNAVTAGAASTQGRRGWAGGAPVRSELASECRTGYGALQVPCGISRERICSMGGCRVVSQGIQSGFPAALGTPAREVSLESLRQEPRRHLDSCPDRR